jgi:hypothetical protein
MIPKTKPMTDARPTAGADSRRSAQRGISSLNFGRIALTASTFSRLIRISEIPNRPIASAVKDSPAVSSVLPKVRRGTPVSLSSPTVANASPSAIMAAVFAREPPDTAVMTASASKISTTCTDGPMAIITLASGGVMNIRPSMETVPPTKLPSAAIIRAGPARPLRAIS